MKTNLNKMLLNAGKVLVLMFAMFFVFVSNAWAGNAPKQNSDTASFITISGKIVDKETLKPIMYANVSIVGTSAGTVANSEGEFIIKVAKNKPNDQIAISHIGYKTFKSSADLLKKADNKIILEQELISLKEIIVRIEDPISLIKGALSNVRYNYRTNPVMVTGFYRETMKQNRKYVSIAEAVLEGYKASYTNNFVDDRVKVVIGRKGQDVKKMDTLLVKLQGGPVTPFYLDIVKNPGDIFSDDYIKYYDFKLDGQTSIDNKHCYIVSFTQKPSVDLPLYDGKVYIEVETLAIVGLEFSLSKTGIAEATSLFVKKKPLTLNFETLGADYLVRYTEVNGKWCLNYVRSELKFKCKWKKKLFSSNYTAMVEMAITDIDSTNVNKIKSKESISMNDVFSDKADDFKNDEFWGDYNYIKPDESIQNAIEKLSKKLKKK